MSFILFFLFYLTLQYCIGFAIYQNESTTDIHVSFNFMATITICSDFGAQKIKPDTVSQVLPKSTESRNLLYYEQVPSLKGKYLLQMVWEVRQSSLSPLLCHPHDALLLGPCPALVSGVTGAGAATTPREKASGEHGKHGSRHLFLWR